MTEQKKIKKNLDVLSFCPCSGCYLIIALQVTISGFMSYWMLNEYYCHSRNSLSGSQHTFKNPFSIAF